MDRMGGLNDNQQLGKSLNELVSAFEEPVTIKKWTSNAAELPANGVAPAGVYTSIVTTAVIDDIGLEKLTGADNVFAAGDLQFQTRIPLTAPLTGPSGSYHPGDRIVYDGAEYKLVQKSMRENLSGTVYFTCIGRRIDD